MARGDVTVFDEAKLAIENGEINMGSDVINLGIINNVAAPTAGDALPHWGGTGTVNHALNEVSTAGGYTGPVDIAVTTSEAAGTVTVDPTSNPVFSQNAGGATDMWWGIIYDSTIVSRRAIAFLDLGGPASVVDGQVVVTWNVAGLYTKT